MKWMRKSLGWIAGIGVGGLVLWQIGTAISLRSTQADSAGLLFNKKVSLQSYQQAQEAGIHELILSHGEKYLQQIKPEELDQLTWDRLILLAEAHRMGIRVSDKELIQEIRISPIFQTPTGQFDKRVYEYLIENYLHITPRAYEEEFREKLIIRKLMDRTIGNPTVTDQEIEEALKKEKETVGTKSAKKTVEEKDPVLQKEKIRQKILTNKRVQAYLLWYQDLLKRANPKKLLPPVPSKSVNE